MQIQKNDSGIILLTVLWIIFILSVIVFSLGRTNTIEIALTKYSVGKVKSYYLARAGVMYAMNLIQMDSKSNESDWGRLCGLKIEDGKSPEDILKDIPLGDGHFDLSFSVKDESSGKMRRVYGLRDEESKINLNALDAGNYPILKSLLELKGVSAEESEVIAASVVDWHDEDIGVTGETSGAESEFYESQKPSYKPKNLPFDQIEEIMLVRGMTKEIFAKIKDEITVFPKDTDPLKINFNTASKDVLRAVARLLPDQADADKVADKIIEYRSGSDGILYTEDDKLAPVVGESFQSEYGFSVTEDTLFRNLVSQNTLESSFIHIKSRGKDGLSEVYSEIDAIVDRTTLAIVDWKRN